VKKVTLRGKSSGEVNRKKREEKEAYVCKQKKRKKQFYGMRHARVREEEEVWVFTRQ